MAECTSQDIDLTDDARPTLDVADGDSAIITECSGDDVAPFTLRFEDRDPLDVRVRSAMVARRAHRPDKDLALELRLGPWSVSEAEEEASRLVEHLGLQRREWLDEWVIEADAAPVPADADIRSRVLSADLAADVDVSFDLARQSNEDVVFGHMTIRWTTVD